MPGVQILFQDDAYVAVYKPANLFVHRTQLAADRDVLLTRVRDALGQWVYPVHRLDRPAAGIVVFGKSSGAAAELAGQFREATVGKQYLAVARGYVDDADTIDYPLLSENGESRKDAVTDYEKLATVELPIPVGPYDTARYSLVRVRPRTGRYHQIRLHFSHISHPLVGDVAHGKGDQNRLFRTHFNCHRLLLVSTGLEFHHPGMGKRLQLKAEPDAEIVDLFKSLGWQDRI